MGSYPHMRTSTRWWWHMLFSDSIRKDTALECSSCQRLNVLSQLLNLPAFLHGSFVGLCFLSSGFTENHSIHLVCPSHRFFPSTYQYLLQDSCILSLAVLDSALDLSIAHFLAFFSSVASYFFAQTLFFNDQINFWCLDLIW